MTQPTVAVAAIVFDEHRRVLLVQRGRPPAQGLWSVPGGKVERGESLAAAVAREVLEETGLIVEVGPLAEIVERIGGAYHYVILDFVGRVVGGTLTAGDDARAVQFVDDAALATLACSDGLAPVLERARATHAAWLASRSSLR